MELHLEQYRHATFNPIDYYEEGLRRSPGDVRCNNAMGLLYLRRGQFEKSLPYFRTAIKTLTSRNPNPYDGEVYYNSGLALQLLGELDDAYDHFFKVERLKDRTFYIYAVICFPGFLFICRKVKETKGKTLEELEDVIVRH